MKPRVICIDDEPRVLKGIRRSLGRSFDLTLVESGAEALAAMRSSDPFHVIVSDMKMPAMSGAQLLAATRAEYPDSVRVLLTGQADLTDAVAAVNDGNIFRFLLKPCPTEVLSAALTAAYEHNRLITSERELLEQTVRGSVALLSEILAIRDPAAAARGTRLRDQVARVAEYVDIDRSWDIEIAAMVSEIGNALIPSEIVDRAQNGATLTQQERELLERQPSVVRDLVANIPRLESVAEILGGLAPGSKRLETDRVKTAVALIKAAQAFDGLLRAGHKEGAAVQMMRKQHPELPSAIVGGFEELALASGGYVIKSVRVSDLVSGIRLAEDLLTSDGRLLLTAGAEVTPAAHTRIVQYADHVGIREPIRVRLPR